MKWMYCFTPALHYRPVAGSEERVIANGFFGLFFSLAPWAVGAYVLVSLLQYSVPLLFIYKLSTLVEVKGSAVISLADIALLAFLAISGFLLVVSELNLERFISLKLCREFERLLARKVEPQVDVSVLERLVSRDFSVILDGIGASVNLLAIPVFLLLSILLALLVFGSGGFWAVAVISLFLPLSYLLSMLSERNYQRIMNVAAQRIEQCSAWLREGPWLKQFAEWTALQSIERTLAGERSLRNLDTLLRGADSYIIGFGRLIPFVLLGLLGTSESVMVWDGAIFWLSIPLLAAVLALPRSYVSYKTVGRSLEALNDLYQNSSRHPVLRPFGVDQTGSVIKFDADWPIWPAALVELIPGPLEIPQEDLQMLLVAFRLVPELGEDPQQVLQVPIELDGSNLSAGQRLRLQLLRGVFLAHMQGGTLSIDHDFSVLDTAAALAVKDALERLSWVSFSPSAAGAIEQREGSPAQVDERTASRVPASGEAHTRFSLGDLFKYCCSGVLMLLVPAMMMSYAAKMMLPEAGFSPWQVLLYAVAGVGTGIAAGLFIENLLRSRFSRLFTDGLRDIRVTSLADALQVVSRDVTTTFERIAWYVHDIAWIIALLLCNGAVLWMGFGLLGISVALLFGGMLALLYRLSINELYQTRLESVKGFDSLLRSGHVAFAISRAAGGGGERMGGWLALTQRGAVAEGLKHFYITRMRSVITRTVTAASCTLLSDLVIVLVVLMGSLYLTSDSAFVLSVTALLLVRSDLSNVFIAITGFKSQSVSVERLQHFARPKSSVGVEIVGQSLHIAPFAAQRAYRALRLERGRLYSLSGPSGSGKSEYLKGVAGISDVVIEEAGAGQALTLTRYYLDWNALALLGCEPGASNWLDTWLSALPEDRHHLLLLDEPFRALRVEQLAERVQALHRYVERSGNTLVLVDHRCRLEHDIELGELAR
ncbi:ABC transporter ATP-binding protein [Pseudomonas sp. NPDC090203]|uniref:ATP-binding cassette domain-containing protein n=1 Tax=Pseudomonas sp. NPDC090203 TaxID=3364477 RepID=UPI0037F68787